jgi:sodium transport system permease protein
MFVLPILALSVALGVPILEVFGLNRPKFTFFVAAIVAGSSGWAVAALTTQLMPPPPQFLEKFTQELALDGVPLPIVVLVLAVLPATCEEFVFRGFIYSGLRRLGPWTAIVATATLFGIMHGSVYRFLPTTTLGIALGYMRWRSGSLFPGILMHATNNAVLVIAMRIAPKIAVSSEAIPVYIYMLVVPIFLCGMWLAKRGSEAEPEGATLASPGE